VIKRGVGQVRHLQTIRGPSSWSTAGCVGSSSSSSSSSSCFSAVVVVVVVVHHLVSARSECRHGEFSPQLLTPFLLDNWMLGCFSLPPHTGKSPRFFRGFKCIFPVRRRVEGSRFIIRLARGCSEVMTGLPNSQNTKGERVAFW